MEHIRLSKDAKAALRLLSVGAGRPADMSPRRYEAAVEELETLGLASVARTEGGGIEGARLSRRGLQYYNANPTLRNPVNWAKVGAIAAVVSAIAMVAALLTACKVLLLNVST